MTTPTSEQSNINPQTSYITDSTTPAINGTNETLCDIKITCTQRKKRSKRYVYLTFIEMCDLSSTDEQQSCIEISKPNMSSILLDGYISVEYFDTIKNDFQSFIYIYFETYTVSIHFSEELMTKKSNIMKHLDYLYRKKIDKSVEINKQQTSQELSCLSSTEQILHTFDVKLVPYGTIIGRDHFLIGRVRLYFTTTDLYIASIDCNQADLKTTIANQCPSKDKDILCIPYFTIKHYGNRSNIFLIELGKSNYGNGFIHMKCISSSLASTIHLLVSPVIEERPLILSSAFQNQLLTNKRMEKSKNIQPPIQLNHDGTNTQFSDRTLSFLKKHSIESAQDNSTKSDETKSNSVIGWFRKLVKSTTQIQRSYTFDTSQNQLNQQIKGLSPSSSTNKFFELHIDDKQIQNENQSLKSLNTNDTLKSINEKSNPASLVLSQPSSPLSTATTKHSKPETTIGTYIDMGPTVEKPDHHKQEEIHEEKLSKETATTTVDVGINTVISLPPYVHSAIIVGTSVHLIAEERAVFPIGQRSFTSPASVMQPFKAQLRGQTTATETNMASNSINNSSSIPQTMSGSNSQKSLFLSYGIVTLNKIPLNIDQSERCSSPLSDGSNIDRRLNSDLSIMSGSHQIPASNSSAFDKILSSSSSSGIFRTLSLSTNNVGDNTSGQICTSRGSIIFLDETLNDQTTTYLLGAPPLPPTEDPIQPNLSRVSSVNLTGSISRTMLSNINEEKISSNDSYAFVEPSSMNNSPSSNKKPIQTKSSLSSEQSINYTDVLLPSSTNDDEQQDSNTIDQINDQLNNFFEEKTERSSTIIYTDIDFQQTERRDRIAQLAAISKSKTKTPPFVL